jgi:hypothetical protein
VYDERVCKELDAPHLLGILTADHGLSDAIVSSNIHP